MFTSEQYRTKADEYSELARAAANANEAREFAALEKSFSALADNEKWLADNHDHTLTRKTGGIGEVALAVEEEYVLRCLGAALIMQWNTLPAKLKRELFDNASAMGELSDTSELRGQIARFLHKHKDSD
jgi:hypothetical protein